MIIVSRWSSVIKLLTIKQVTNDNGYPIDKEIVINEIYANEKSVRSTEFYQAAMAGKAVQKMFEVYTQEFIEEATHIETGNKRYEIIRTYINGDRMEVVCTQGSSVKQSGGR